MDVFPIQKIVGSEFLIGVNLCNLRTSNVRL
jgi:hypothetical protein